MHINSTLLFPEVFFLVLEDMLYFYLVMVNDAAAVMLTLNVCSLRFAVIT